MPSNPAALPFLSLAMWTNRLDTSIDGTVISQTTGFFDWYQFRSPNPLAGQLSTLPSPPCRLKAYRRWASRSSSALFTRLHQHFSSLPSASNTTLQLCKDEWVSSVKKIAPSLQTEIYQRCTEVIESEDVKWVWHVKSVIFSRAQLCSWATGACLFVYCKFVMRKKCVSKTGPLQLIWHNFTNSQHSLIIFGTEIPYSILHWLW